MTSASFPLLLLLPLPLPLPLLLPSLPSPSLFPSLFSPPPFPSSSYSISMLEGDVVWPLDQKFWTRPHHDGHNMIIKKADDTPTHPHTHPHTHTQTSRPPPSHIHWTHTHTNTSTAHTLYSSWMEEDWPAQTGVQVIFLWVCMLTQYILDYKYN